MPPTEFEQSSLPVRVVAPSVSTRTLVSVGVLGLFVIPCALVVMFNSYVAPDDAAYLRMAFAVVAAQTISIVTAFALVVLTFRSTFRRQLVAAIIVLCVISSAASSFQREGERLIQVLG